MKRIVGLLTIAAVCLSCGFVKVRSLSDADIDNFLTANAALRQVGPKLGLEDINSGQADGQAGFAQVEAAIKEAGFSGYREFVEVTAAIGAAVSVLEGQATVATYDAAAQDINAAMPSEMRVAFDEFMNDPNNTPEMKAAFEAQLRASLGEAQANFNTEYARNKPFATAVLEFFTKNGNDANLELVRPRLREITAALAGQ